MMKMARKRYVRRDEIKMSERKPEHLQRVGFREVGHKSYLSAYYNAETNRFEHENDECKTDARYVTGWIEK